MFDIRYIFVILAFFTILFLPTYAKEKHIYENGILLDIKIGQEYQFDGGVIGSHGQSKDVYYPVIKVGDIAYLGKTKSKLNDLIIGETIKVRFNKNKTTIYLTDSSWDSGIEIVKKAKL